MLTTKQILMVFGAVVIGSFTTAQAESGFPETTSQAQEYDGIHHVLAVLGNTNVHRIDRQTAQNFQDYIDVKSTVNNEPVHKTATIQKNATPGVLPAPRKLNTRAF